MTLVVMLSVVALLLVTTGVRAQQQRPSSFSPVIEEPFDVVRARDKANKSRVMAESQRRLEERYDLSRRVDEGVRMTRGKPIPVGPTAKLKSGLTWERLGSMTPAAIRDGDLFPYLPLPHVSHPVGGMVFSQAEIKLLPRVERFDMDFDLPDHFLPEFPPAMFLSSRKDLGDVSKGQLITVNNFYELFNGLLNPKQLEGLRPSADHTGGLPAPARGATLSPVSPPPMSKSKLAVRLRGFAPGVMSITQRSGCVYELTGLCTTEPINVSCLPSGPTTKLPAPIAIVTNFAGSPPPAGTE